ncbi:MAG: D-glycerate dehydrogenase [Candidatus Abyssobacteria bacterium SURF_5]|uniref:D-glycerate dehydrogenase n=1 Tax=Abyssobacteria bacterium (strain SURF_5) TaxID=2093360 RepID=A0A3A4NQ96_ABYX5|nr:MAG: D-glycerate dehydrogenase [Candidatus Abyssubacteria bacterium SURF_5]
MHHGEEKARVFVSQPIPTSAIALLEKHFRVIRNADDRILRRNELKKALRDADGLLSLLTDKIDGDLLAGAPKLRIVANMAVGYDNVDLKAATERGIMVTNTPGVLTETTADLAWALILGVARRLVESDRYTREGKFRGWGPMLFLGTDVYGKTLGIIGFGRIGQALARRARGFKMKVLFYDEMEVSPRVYERLKARPVTLETLLREADYISLHVPLTDTTRRLISREQLGMMKSSAYLINTSRGPIIDEKELVRALKSKQIAGAGLDVYEKEPALAAGLKGLSNAVLLPHIGSASVETRTKMALMAAENIRKALSGKRPPNLLNEVRWNRGKQP